MTNLINREFQPALFYLDPSTSMTLSEFVDLALDEQVKPLKVDGAMIFDRVLCTDCGGAILEDLCVKVNGGIFHINPETCAMIYSRKLSTYSDLSEGCQRA